MTLYDAVLFDLDGTLTDSEPGIVGSLQYALEALNHKDVPMDRVRKFLGPPLYESFTGILGMDDEMAREGIRLYRERFAEVGWSENSVYPGIPRLLRSLKDSGVYLAVATVKARVFAERVLKHFGLYDFFDAVCGTELQDMHADKGEIIGRALPEKYERACMVGDRGQDMVGAAANNIDALGVVYGYGGREELLEGGATAVYEDVATLTRALLSDEELRPGAFITLEGSDGSGKSTQMEPLVNWLKACGYEVVPTCEPGGCQISKRIREFVLGIETVGVSDLCEAYLFAAARAQHVTDVIAPALADGKIVVCDRFVDSSAAYQGAGRGLGIEAVLRINEAAVQGHMPDLTILFDLDPEVAFSRRRESTGLDRIEVEGAQFMRRVYEGYQNILRGNPERVVAVDGSGSAEDVMARTRSAVMKALAK